MDNINKEKLILSLIKDDLINAKLINSLRDIGLHSDCSTIFELMGFKDNEKTDEIYDRYIELTEGVKWIDILESNKLMEELALKIYEVLVKINGYRFRS